MPSALQSVFKTDGLSGSNRARIGEDVTPTLSSSKSAMSAGVHPSCGISFFL